MKKILTPILLIVGIFAGSAGANFLKAPAAEKASEEKSDGEYEKDGKDGSKEKSDKKKSSKKDSGKGGGYGESEISYFKFSREFVVPLTRDNQVESLIILNLNLEIDSSESGSLFSKEPKLRDNIMSSLIELSNDGSTLDNFSQVESYETIRSVVLENLKRDLGAGILNVLILDMAKQQV